LTLTVVGLRASEKAKPCTPRDEARAETESALPKSWTEFYKSCKKFAKCDDGGVGEGYSESIDRLASDQWSTADQLNRLASRDQGFERFVLRHIDVLMTPEQARTIRANAETRCPSDAVRLCEKIINRIRESGPEGR
jgi:hypothetical protein